VTDVVKRQVAAHWDRRAPHFDEDFGHSIRTPAERAAWDRILDLVLPARTGIDALDAGCGTGFLSFELAARGHHVIGVDFASSMIAEARRKAAERGVSSVGFDEADAEQLPFMPASFDLVISRHLLWTLAHPEVAIDEWIRVLRPGGRLVVVDGQFDAGAAPAPGSARSSAEYAAVGDQLPFLGGRSMEQIEALFTAHGLVHVSGDPLLDLVTAQAQRMVEEGRERRTHRRYVVWGDLAG
jgi:ubiquinone/menaquinone biosynthesis C-methylase UbiE